MTEPAPPPLPELEQGLLDAAGLAALVADLHAHATVIDVVAKGGALVRADGRNLGLDEGIAALKDGQVRGLQLRYRHEDVEWWDTLIAAPGGWRIVRIRHDPPV
jgi:hypothetical protein